MVMIALGTKGGMRLVALFMGLIMLERWAQPRIIVAIARWDEKLIT